MTLSSDSIHLLEWLTEPRETLTSVYQFIIKGTDEQPSEGVRRTRYRERSMISPHLYVFTDWEALPALSPWGFIELYLHRHN